MKNDRVGDEESLVVRSNERCWKIYGQMWYVLENEESDRGISREVDNK